MENKVLRKCGEVDVTVLDKFLTLLRRARNIRIRTEDTAVSGLWSENDLAVYAQVEELTSIGWHL